ncbi:MAG: hypothetical protein ACRDOL_32245 [Streptosporangiaceae bacterium]
MTNPNTMTRLTGRAAPDIRAPGIRTLGAIAAGLMAVVLCSCGSSVHSVAAATQDTCQRVSAVLGDGPDPDADPVGYAEAQVLPLRQISTSDQALRNAIGQLADAYRQIYDSNGTSSKAKESVTVASKKVDSICPRATS